LMNLATRRLSTARESLCRRWVMRCTLRSTGGLTATSTGVLDRHAHRLPYSAAADQQRIVSGIDLHNGRGVEPLLHDDRARVIGQVHQPGVLTGAPGVRVVLPGQDVLSDEVLAGFVARPDVGFVFAAALASPVRLGVLGAEGLPPVPVQQA